MDDAAAPVRQPDARFEVESHYEMASRGGFIIGRVTEGRAAPGMVALGPVTGSRFTVVGFETLCNPGVQRCKHALIFRGSPSLGEVSEAFPIGSVVGLFL
jgi:hypothetical protein